MVEMQNVTGGGNGGCIGEEGGTLDDESSAGHGDTESRSYKRHSSTCTHESASTGIRTLQVLVVVQVENYYTATESYSDRTPTISLQLCCNCCYYMAAATSSMTATDSTERERERL
jgi:hypothetical protein